MGDDYYEGEETEPSASGPKMHPSTTIGGAPSTELSVRRTATETTQSGGVDPITERMIAVMKCGLLLGACISLALLILLALARIRKTQMMERDASGNVWYLPGAGNITRGVGAGPGAAGGGGGHPGLIAVPLAIFTVVLASVLLFIYEQQVLASQQSSQYFWNWMKVGLICVLVGLAATHKKILRLSPDDRPFRVSWRIFIYCILGIFAMALAKLANRATRPYKSKYSDNKH